MPAEMKSTQIDDRSAPQIDDDLDPQALSAIRTLIQTEAEAPPARAPSPRNAIDRDRMDDSRAQSVAPARKAGAGVFDEVRPQKSLPSGGGFFGKIKASVFGYRPKPKHIAIALACLLVLFRPWLVVGLLLLFALSFVCLFLIVGYDGFWQRVIGFGRWYASRRPSKAQELHAKLDAFALKWDGFLDRFPEGTVDGLYLPDLGDLAKADARHDEAVDRRLAGLREGEA